MITYFDEFPHDVKSIGLSLSGGTDSALAFYWLLKTLSERGQQTKVYAMHGYDTHRKVARSYEAADRVYDWIISQFDIDIPPLFTFAYNKNKPVGKYEYHYPNVLYLQRKYNIVDNIMGDTLDMPDDDRPTFDTHPDDPYKQQNKQELVDMAKKHPLRAPFATVNKKFIAAQYKKFNLNYLSTLTVSCTGDDIKPCKQCWWCRERKWAFGTYDGGVD